MAVLCWMSRPADSGQIDGPKSLFKASTFPAGWTFFSAEGDPKAVWKAIEVEGKNGADDELQCKGKGKPFGYIRTQKLYGDFVFTLEWKYPNDVNGNTGVLIHTGKDNKIWPNAIQAQLHAPTAGSIFPSGDAKTNNKLMASGLSKPVNQWNTLHIRSEAGGVVVTINGKKAGEVTGCQPSMGRISLQSEGSEVHFRRVMLEPLK
jgi:hypothetical protein